MFTILHLIACLITMACSTWDVTTGATCQPHKSVRRSGSTWWGHGLGARATNPTPTALNATADVKSVAVDEDVVFSLAVQTNAQSIQTTFVNLTAADLILFLQCMLNPSSQACDFPSNYNIYSPDVSQLNHTIYNFTCTLNTTTLQCMTSIDYDIEPFGMFKIIKPGMNGMSTVYLSIDTTLALISVQWKDLRYIHFVCLYHDSGTKIVGWILVYNIIGASMAFVVLVLLIVTVWQSCRARSRHRKEMDSLHMVKVELNEMKKSHIQSNLETNSTNTLSLSDNPYLKDRDTTCRSSCLVPELNLAFQLNDESLHITRL